MDDALEFTCPYCASTNSTPIDYSQGSSQEWVIDCEICCRPIIINIAFNASEIRSFNVRKEND